TNYISSILVISSSNTGKNVLYLFSPFAFTFHGRDCSISPYGTLVAVPAVPAAVAAADSGSSPALLLYNAAGGVSRRILLPGFEKERFRASITPQASAFSRDGKRVAVLVNHHRSSLLFICGVNEGKVLASFAYPDLDTALH